MGHTVVRIQKPRKYEVLLPFHGSFLKTTIPHSTLIHELMVGGRILLGDRHEGRILPGPGGIHPTEGCAGTRLGFPPEWTVSADLR
jgi:hypothetical protein